MLFNRRDGSSPFPEPVNPPFPGAFGVTTSDSALRLDAVWACVRLLSDTVSMMPLQALDERGGVEVPLPRARQPRLLIEPAPGLTMSEWVGQMMVSLLLRGNAYAEWGGNVLEGGTLVPLNPDVVNVSVVDGRIVYRIRGEERKNIFHIRGHVLPGQVTGLSPIAYAATMLQTQQAIDNFARGYFTDAPHPAQLVTTDQPINQEQAKSIKDRIMANVGSRDPLVLGLGLKMDTISVSPEESQFLQTQQFGATRIARIFGVPPEMIGAAMPGSSVTYQNMTQRASDYKTYAVQGWLTRIEQAVSRVLPRRQHVRFDASALVRMTPMDAAKVDEVYLNKGAKVINEIRRPLGLEDVSWGDEPYLPGMSPAAAGAVAAADAGEGEV